MCKTKQTLFYYPSAGKGNKYDNPYSENLKKSMEPYFHVLESDNKCVERNRSFRLFIRAFQADVFILSWIEQIWKFKMGSFFCKLSVYLMHKRNKKVVWIFHNLEPHAGENKWSRNLKSFFLRHSDYIITHSTEALEQLQFKTVKPLIYIPHPIQPIVITNKCYSNIKFDVLIWGSILPYKGIVEFLSNEFIRNSNLNIRIIGKCKDEVLLKTIKSKCNEHILLENRYAKFDELAILIQNSRWVLFPYVGTSISSSGALIDTIAMGGTPIGPNRGAFYDLAQEGVCAVYEDYNDLFIKLQGRKIIPEACRQRFMKRNSWENFAEKIYKTIYASN